jgi:hypothetical protein
MLLGQFAGSWDLERAGTAASGEPATAAAESASVGRMRVMSPIEWRATRR